MVVDKVDGVDVVCIHIYEYVVFCLVSWRATRMAVKFGS